MHISIDCCINGALSKISLKRFERTTASKEDNRKKFKKRVQKAQIVALKNDWNILVQGESCLYMICTKEENDG